MFSSVAKRARDDDDVDDDDEEQALAYKEEDAAEEQQPFVVGQPFKWFVEPDLAVAPFDHRQPRKADTYRASVAGRPLDEGLFRSLARYNRMVDTREHWPERSKFYAVSNAHVVAALKRGEASGGLFAWLPTEIVLRIVPYLLIVDLVALVRTGVWLYSLLRNELRERIMGTPYMHPSMLSHELLHMIDVVAHRRESLFLTGEAGSGKTTLLAQFVQWVTLFGRMDVVCVAPTGLAAKHLDGTTMHSAFSIGYSSVNEHTTPKVVDLFKQSQRNVVLVIDEVSMCTADMFEFLVKSLRLSTRAQVYHEATSRETAFGYGIVVACGDFAQLPPVIKKKDSSSSSSSGSSGGAAAGAPRPTYAFQSHVWKATFEASAHNTLYLQRQYRQRGDPRYVEFLRRVRDGHVTAEDMAMLNTRIATARQKQSLSGTLLCTRNALVEEMNQRYIDQLAGDRVGFPACERGMVHTSLPMTFSPSRPGSVADEGSPTTLATNTSFSEPEGFLRLKVGARVLLTVNHRTPGAFYNPSLDSDDGAERVPNGSVGVVVEIVRNKARFVQLSKQYGILQSVSTAKFHSHGSYNGSSAHDLRLRVYHTERVCHLNAMHMLSDDRLVADNPGELSSLVARRMMLDSERAMLNDLSDEYSIECYNHAVELYHLDRQTFYEQHSDGHICVGSMMVTAVPLVRFDAPANITALVMPCVERHFRYDRAYTLVRPGGEPSSVQRPADGQKQVKTVERVHIAFPLRVARAITAHKAQGATLCQVTVDMQSMFEYGHPYTMLSRVPSFSELWLSNRTSAQAINRLADPAVAEYYARLMLQATRRPQFDCRHLVHRKPAIAATQEAKEEPTTSPMAIGQ